MLKFIDPDQALEIVLEASQPLSPKRLSLDQAHATILAEDVRCDRPYPPFDKSRRS